MHKDVYTSQSTKEREQEKYIAKAFCGVTERRIQIFLNRQQINLKPVTSKEVMNRIQMDIVDMNRNPVEISEDKVFRYVLVVLDVFSRFIFLRPLQSKSSTEVAAVVMQIFSDVGPPKIIQTDQGTEFKGVVEQVMNKLKVKIIHSRPYHAQSQGKVVLLIISFVMVIHAFCTSQHRLRGLIARGSLS